MNSQSDDRPQPDDKPPIVEPVLAEYVQPEESSIPPVANPASVYSPPGYVDRGTSRSSPANWLIAFLVGIAAPFAGLLVSLTVMASVLLLSVDQSDLRDATKLQKWMVDFTATIPGLMVMVVPGQLTFLAIAYGCAKFAREGWIKRLALGKGRVPAIVWPIFALATPVIGLFSSILVSWVLEKMQWEVSAHLESLENVLTGFTGPNFIVLVLMVSVIPGFCEELLFRGYVQSRLTKAWAPALAILFSAACFAFAHMDPMHMAIVFPIGVWLGVISWKAGSIWPAIMGHVINNLVSIVGSQSESFGISESHFVSGVMLVSGLALIFSVGLVVALPTKSPDE